MIERKNTAHLEGIKVQKNLDGFSVMVSATPYQEMPLFYDMPALRILSHFKRLSFKMCTPPPTPPTHSRAHTSHVQRIVANLTL
jgi:hypothetical protein